MSSALIHRDYDFLETKTLRPSVSLIFSTVKEWFAKILIIKKIQFEHRMQEKALAWTHDKMVATQNPLSKHMPAFKLH